MDCIRCGDPDAFNRVVVNQLSKHELGVFCATCEGSLFGTLLEEPAWHQAHGCAFCDDNGPFAVPRLECLIEYDDGTLRRIEYDSLEDAVHLCERHLRVLVGTDAVSEERREPDERHTPTLEA